MKIQNLKCQECGAKLNVQTSTLAQVCKYCGAQIIIDVVLKDENSQYEKLIEKGNALLTLKSFQQAEELFKEAIKENPKNYHGWLGLAKSKSENFTKANNDSIDNIDKATSVANEEEQKSIDKECENYLNAYLFEYKRRKKKRNTKKILTITFSILLGCTLAYLFFKIF